MIAQIDIDTFLFNEKRPSLIDVRSPAEFLDGHIPGACNIPLFTNDERAKVGTLYKSKGPEEALKLGLDFVGSKMRHICEMAHDISLDNTVAVHCWRGGKRSESVGWLLDFSGLDVMVLNGGYRAYRRYVHEYVSNTEFNLTVLGGRTGSAKTAVLHVLDELGEQVLDLERLANHKGSAFGWIGEKDQPTTKQFENDMFDAIQRLDPSKRIWVENESKSIGRVYIPDGFWKIMKEAPLIHLEVPIEKRVDHLVSLYAAAEDKAALIESFSKIERRLGGQNLKFALSAIEKGNYAEAAQIALSYYDKTYDYNLNNNGAPEINILDAKDLDIHEIAVLLRDSVIQKAY